MTEHLLTRGHGEEETRGKSGRGRKGEGEKTSKACPWL